MSKLNLSIGLAFAATSLTASAQEPPPSRFEEASITVEQNATDGDTEILISGTAGDDGLRWLAIKSPDGERMTTLLAAYGTPGMREFAFETPEPPGEAILAFYPEGTYVLKGISTTGEVFRSFIRLSHDLPPAVTILHPQPDAELPAGEPLTVRWSAAPGIEEFVFEFENESEEREQAFTINLPPHVTSYRIPGWLMARDGEFQVGVHTVAENGNIVAVESAFTTTD